MQLVHPDDMEAIDGEYYQNFHSFDGDISELGLSFSDLLYCPVCGNHESFDLPTSNGNKYNVTENNKVWKIKPLFAFISATVCLRLTLLKLSPFLSFSIQSRKKLYHF